MRKPTKTSMTRKLDKECSDQVRSRGLCERCGPAIYYEFSELQCAHIWSRVYRNTRWNLKNLLSLCASCHFWAHRNPLDFADWVRDHIGIENYNYLKQERNKIMKWTINGMVEYYESLKGHR